MKLNEGTLVGTQDSGDQNETEINYKCDIQVEVQKYLHVFLIRLFKSHLKEF